MRNALEYKGYIGSVVLDTQDRTFHGRVLGIGSVVSFAGKSIDELEQDFRGAVDDYLEMCEEDGIEPGKPFSGNFTVRISPELHRKIAIAAQSESLSVNRYVTRALEGTIDFGPAIRRSMLAFDKTLKSTSTRADRASRAARRKTSAH